MKIVRAYPPNYPVLKRRFQLTQKDRPIFAYGDRIFNPHNANIGPELLAHETVHGERQRIIGVSEWWLRYINDNAFRLEEEILAHRAELQYLAGNKTNTWAVDIEYVAKRLSARMYGNMISYDDAVKVLTVQSHLGP